MSQGLSGITDTNIAKAWHQVASDDSTHRPKAAKHFKKSNEHYVFIIDIHMLRRLETGYIYSKSRYAFSPSQLAEPISKNIRVTKWNVRARTSLNICSLFNRAS